MPKFWLWRRARMGAGERTVAGATKVGGGLGGREGRRTRGGPRRLSVEPLEERRLLAAVTLSDADQLMLELTNRARANPVAEAARYGLSDLNQGLAPGTISTAVKPPLAPHQLLVDAAEAHTQWMLANQTFTHDGPAPGESFGTRLSDAGYRYTAAGENIAWVGTTGVLGPTSAKVAELHTNLFRSPGHRVNILSPAFVEMGTGVRSGNFTYQGTTYHVMMATEDFGRRTGSNFLTGVSYADADEDRFYSIGEGLAGIVITAIDTSRGNTYTTTSGPSGGYSLQVPPGTYEVQATGVALGTPVRRASVAMGLANVKIDFLASADSAPVPGADVHLGLKDQAASVPVLTNDTARLGLDAGSVTIARAPGHGQAQVEVGTGVITYLPAVGFVGLDSFTYQVADVQGHVSPPTSVSITVVDLARHPWQNPQTRTDVNGDGGVSALDALLLVTRINQNGAGPLAAPSANTVFPLPYLDVSGTGDLTATDILMVIDYINADSYGIPVSAEGESAADATWLPERSEMTSLLAFEAMASTERARSERGSSSSTTGALAILDEPLLVQVRTEKPQKTDTGRNSVTPPKRAMAADRGQVLCWAERPDPLNGVPDGDWLVEPGPSE